MGNRLTNCGLLDGITGWTKSAQLGLTVDEDDRGSPGRAVLIGSGVTTAANQTQFIRPAAADRATVQPGWMIEAAAAVVALVNGAPVAPSASVVWFNAASAQIGATPLDVRPAHLSHHGEGLKGVRTTFRTIRQRVAAPATAARADLLISVAPAAAGSSVVLGVLKPQIARVPSGRMEPLNWDPGLHTTPDLDLPAWPIGLRAFDLGPDGEPLPSGVEFQGEAPGRPSQRRTGLSPARQFAGSLRCDPYERAVLDDFWRDTPGDFWIVEPSSDRLCVARFASDGQPRMTEDRGEVSTIAVNLWLETA